jgi:hypothetical protein
VLDDGRRLELLAAIGIEVYRLRAAPDAGARAPLQSVSPQPGELLPAAEGSPRLVIACPDTVRRAPGFARATAHLVRALGVQESIVRWIDTAPGGVSALPDVPAYLMIGPAAARACSAHLSIEQQNSATIAVSAEAADLFSNAAARRATWQALKPLVRRLRSGRPG